MNRFAPSIDEIFFAALEVEDPKDRSSYLDQACGSDPDLRHRVDELLAANPLVSRFLEFPAASPTITVDHSRPLAEGPGTVIGPYKLLD